MLVLRGGVVATWCIFLSIVDGVCQAFDAGYYLAPAVAMLGTPFP